jgi:hypothetical protein
MNYSGPELLARLEREFAEDKIANFKGTARVRISQLLFPNPIRPLNKKIRVELKRKFGREGCLQNERDCTIPAVIDDSILHVVFEKLGVSAESFKANSISNPTKFEIPGGLNVECLHGQHRVAAAAEYLPPEHRWWRVDIYGSG